MDGVGAEEREGEKRDGLTLRGAEWGFSCSDCVCGATAATANHVGRYKVIIEGR